MNIGIVGNRDFPQLKMVEWFVRDLPQGVTIISGGAAGVDSAAVSYARERGLQTKEYLPDLSGCKDRWQFTERYYLRNQEIADNSDMIVAFIQKEKGGTWDTIKRARKLGKPIKIIKPAVFFPGDMQTESINEDADEENIDVEESPQQKGRSANKGKGPFAIKRVSLGSYALRRKCYIDSEEWADIVNMKDNDPEKLAESIAPTFIDFFTSCNRLGCIHAITVPPRSIRNLHKPHVMDFVASIISKEFDIEFVRAFNPWIKTSRGRHAKHGDICITEHVKKLVGKVVWVLDDVTTTNYTLQSAVKSLIALEVHAHGLAYVVMA